MATVSPYADTDAVERWFRRSVYLPMEAKRQVTKQLHDYCGLLRGYFERHRIVDVNLQLSGSLARGEPAVVVDPLGMARLASDVDLVAVTLREIGPSHHIRGLVEEMRRLAPEIMTTMFVVQSRQLPRVRSLFGRDLWIGYRRPIVSSFARAAFPEPAIGRREALESLVHHLAGYLLVPTRSGAKPFSREGNDFQRTKLALDALRTMLVPVAGEPVSFASLLSSNRSQAIDDLVSKQELESLIEARELSLPDAVTPDRAEDLAAGALRYLFCAPDADDTMLILRLREHVSRCAHVLPLFQAAVATLFLLGRVDGSDTVLAAGLFAEIWRRLDRSLLVEGRVVADSMTEADIDGIADGEPGALLAVTNAMCLLRLDYYRYLGPHNFGAKPISEYPELLGQAAGTAEEGV